MKNFKLRKQGKENHVLFQLNPIKIIDRKIGLYKALLLSKMQDQEIQEIYNLKRG